jgi:phage FluMu protein Com
VKVISRVRAKLGLWKATVRCAKRDKQDRKGCGTVVQVTQKDLIMLFWRGSHYPHYYLGVQCPTCGKYNVTKDKDDVPEWIWKKFNTARGKKKAIFDGFSDASSYYDGP